MAHIRIVHFMIIVIVVLTIFLYSLLYTASPEMNTIVHAGTPHHYVVNSKDSSSSDSFNNKNILQNGDILVSSSLIASDRNEPGGVGNSAVPSLEQKESVDILSNRMEGEDGVGSVVIRSGECLNSCHWPLFHLIAFCFTENVVDASAMSYKQNISSSNNVSSPSFSFVNGSYSHAGSIALEAKSTAKTSGKHTNADSYININIVKSGHFHSTHISCLCFSVRHSTTTTKHKDLF